MPRHLTTQHSKRVSHPPQHIAIIMDGNGRWAKNQNLPRVMGHEAGAHVAKQVIEWCIELEIPQLTLFAFGKDNWQRPAQETQFLMELFYQQLKAETPALHDKNIRVKVLGEVDSFPASLSEQIVLTEGLTADNSGLKLNIAANYSGKSDIIRVCRELGCAIQVGTLSIEKITEAVFEQKILDPDLTNPDLFIRTSGELRLSNFFLWQAAYTELYFSSVLWPDFKKSDFNKALSAYSRRVRRFGKTDDQLGEGI